MKDNKNSQNELIIKLGFFEQQIRQIQQQIEIVERNMIELNSLKTGLDEFKGAEGREIFSPVGKNIFAKTRLISEELIVDIGNGNFVKKDIENTKKLIGEQAKKLENLREELNSALERINQEMTSLVAEAQERD